MTKVTNGCIFKGNQNFLLDEQVILTKNDHSSSSSLIIISLFSCNACTYSSMLSEQKWHMLERSTGGGLIVSYDIGLLGPERNGLEPVWPKNEYEK